MSALKVALLSVGGQDDHRCGEFDDGDASDRVRGLSLLAGSKSSELPNAADECVSSFSPVPLSQGEYGNPDLIVRRSSVLKLVVDVGAAEGVDLSTNALTIQPKAGWRNGSFFFPSSAALEDGGCATTASSATSVSVQVLLPANMAVGEYTLQVHLGGQQKTASLAQPEPMMILFNPWSEETEEHIPDEEACDEYVMNEDGLAHYGTWHRSGRMAWNYGQFEPACLAAARKILSHLSVADRSTPASLARAVTRAINHQGGGGVLTGNWSGDYVGEGERPEDPNADWRSEDDRNHPANAQPPTHWNGSPAILKQWVQTNAPVAYGQCWVFAGITTTILRTIGCVPFLIVSCRTTDAPRIWHIYIYDGMQSRCTTSLEFSLRSRHAQQSYDRGVLRRGGQQR